MLYLYEHICNEHNLVKKFKNEEEACKYINRVYEVNTKPIDLLYALYTYGTAWLYFNFYQISVETEQKYYKRA